MRAAIRQRRLQLCNGTSRVLISIAIGTETSACNWVDALIENALAFTRADTVVAIHLSSALACPPGDLERWRGTLARGSRGLVNPVRIATQLGHGSVLYGHLLNARRCAGLQLLSSPLRSNNRVQRPTAACSTQELDALQWP